VNFENTIAACYLASVVSLLLGLILVLTNIWGLMAGSLIANKLYSTLAAIFIAAHIIQSITRKFANLS
jgi:hypothetical protein